MLAFFPTPAPDEHFYSIAARYHCRIGNRKATQTMNDLLGASYPMTLTSLPCSLAKLYARLPVGSLNTPANIIANNSLFPILRPFVSRDYGQMLEDQMINTTCHRYLYSALRTIFIASSGKQRLKFCPECVREEMKLHGETYWHRSHQIQGLRICHRHETWLYASDVCWLNSTCRFFALPDSKKVWKSRIPLQSDTTRQHHLTFAKLVNQLLKCDIGTIEKQSLNNLYYSRMKVIKMYSREGYYISYRAKFLFDLRSYFGLDFLNHLHCHNHIYKHALWLSYFFLDNEKYNHPVSHILMMMFLGFDVDDLASIAQRKASTCSVPPDAG